MANRKVALITGGSSGIGLETARALRDKGLKVYIISRREFEEPGMEHYCGDVTQEEDSQRIVSAILEKEKKIDILVNCAGMGISGAIEYTELADARKQIDVNFFGMVNMVHAVLPSMHKRKRGRIVNISSVAAPIPIPFQAFYSASKAAINDYTMALANEIRPYGVTVTAVQPGDIRTGFTDAREKSYAGDKEYGGRISRSVARMEHDERSGMPPEIAGDYICSLALKKHVKPLYAIGTSYKAFCMIMKLLPCRLSNWMIGFLYAK